MLDVELEPDGLGDTDALEAVHLRAHHENILERRLGANLAGHLRIMNPRAVTHPREEPPGDIHAEHFDHLATQRAERLGVDQQHPLIIEPDPPIAGGKTKPRQQIGQVGEAHLVVLDLGWIDDRDAIARRRRLGTSTASHRTPPRFTPGPRPTPQLPIAFMGFPVSSHRTDASQRLAATRRRIKDTLPASTGKAFGLFAALHIHLLMHAALQYLSTH